MRQSRTSKRLDWGTLGAAYVVAPASTSSPVIGPVPFPRFSSLLAIVCILIARPGVAADRDQGSSKVAPPAAKVAPPPLASDEANAQFHVLAGEMAAGRHMPA